MSTLRVDTVQGNTGGTVTFPEAVTVQGALQSSGVAVFTNLFTTRGIDDNATIEMIDIDNTRVLINGDLDVAGDLDVTGSLLIGGAPAPTSTTRGYFQSDAVFNYDAATGLFAGIVSIEGTPVTWGMTAGAVGTPLANQVVFTFDAAMQARLAGATDYFVGCDFPGPYRVIARTATSCTIEFDLPATPGGLGALTTRNHFFGITIVKGG